MTSQHTKEKVGPGKELGTPENDRSGLWVLVPLGLTKNQHIDKRAENMKKDEGPSNRTGVQTGSFDKCSASK